MRVIVVDRIILVFAELHTQNNLQYVYLPETSGAVKLRVKAANDAHIALTNGPRVGSPVTEIFIGGWQNTKSVIRRNKRHDKVEVSTPGILKAHKFVSLWIRWHGNEVSAGLKGESAFIKYSDTNPHPVTHLAVCTGWGASGHWQIEVSPVLFQSLPNKPIKTGQLRWVRKTIDDQLPQDAFIGGYENGEVLYIGRAMQRGCLIPGKYIPSRNCVVVGWGRVLTDYYTCEILCGYNASWLKTCAGFIPPHAVLGGYDSTPNDPSFVGRARMEDNLVPGKAHCSHKICYIPYADTEVDMTTYEVLVVPDKLPHDVVWRLKHQYPQDSDHEQYEDEESAGSDDED